MNRYIVTFTVYKDGRVSVTVGREGERDTTQIGTLRSWAHVWREWSGPARPESIVRVKAGAR